MLLFSEFRGSTYAVVVVRRPYRKQRARVGACQGERLGHSLRMICAVLLERSRVCKWVSRWGHLNCLRPRRIPRLNSIILGDG